MYSWTDIDEIGYQLYEAHPDKDPLQMQFTELRERVEALDGFQPESGQNVNEQILEAIQQAWHREREDIEHDEDNPGYTPPTAYR